MTTISSDGGIIDGVSSARRSGTLALATWKATGEGTGSRSYEASNYAAAREGRTVNGERYIAQSGYDSRSILLNPLLPDHISTFPTIGYSE